MKLNNLAITHKSPRLGESGLLEECELKMLRCAQHDIGRRIRLMRIRADKSAVGAMNRPLLMFRLSCSLT